MTNKKQFSDEWGVILGVSSGFVFATLEKLANHGMNIAVLYRETAVRDKAFKETLKKIASDTQVTILPYNMNALDPSQRHSFIRELSSVLGKQPLIRLLMHSIARGNLKPLFELSTEDINLTSHAMSNSMLEWAKDLYVEGLFASEARIIGLTSEGAWRYWDGYGAVSIAKASLESLSRYMAVELGKFGLRTNVIQAGVTHTPSLERIPDSERMLEWSKGRNPLGRLTTPADVAGAVYLLCTKEAAWINGALLHVDGGEHCI
jgi:enoyl-[acyl-carrier protein] reductase III